MYFNLINVLRRSLKVWLINIILFLVLFFFTSPAYIMSVLETLPFLNAQKFNEDLKNTLPVYITDFLPTLLLWTFTALLPVLVGWADLLVGHATRHATLSYSLYIIVDDILYIFILYTYIIFH